MDTRSSILPLLSSELTCPACQARHAETMPTEACIYFYECVACHAILRPKPGHCCVFCSYGSLPCPPVQMAQAGASAQRCCPTD